MVDIDFTINIVKLMPDMSFVFIGPFSDEYSELTSQINVRALGLKQYEEIPLYGRYFDFAFMVWQKTQWIKMCNTITLKEYLALGKPIVSTPTPEL